MTSPINSSTDQYSEDFYAFHPWQMQACFFAGSCQACDKLNGMINEVQIHEVAQLAKIHIENRSVADRLVVTIIDQRSVSVLDRLDQICQKLNKVTRFPKR